MAPRWLTDAVSGQETMTRRAVEQLLHPQTDASGNLVLRLSSGSAKGGIAFMAHTDELGVRIREVLPDATLDLENQGGGVVMFRRTTTPRSSISRPTSVSPPSCRSARPTHSPTSANASGDGRRAERAAALLPLTGRVDRYTRSGSTRRDDVDTGIKLGITG
jgi:hypothetical protein